MEKTKYTYRIVARIVLEAETPLAVGSGEHNIITDSLVATDANGMPYIPGSSIAGAMRHAMEQREDTDDLFGFQEKSKGAGSRIIFSDALMVGEEGKVLDGIQDLPHSEFYESYRHLPVRQHVRIGHRGVHEDMGKFDEQVTFKGTRFVFDMELVSEGKDEDTRKFSAILADFASGHIRFGGGTRKGFGRMRVVECLWRAYDLMTPADLEEYLDKPSRLDSPWKPSSTKDMPEGTDTKDYWAIYELELQPRDFFLFSSGLDDEDADMTPVIETIVEWQDGKPRLVRDVCLIPASSVKGALSHQVAYHWFKKKKMFVDKDNNIWDNEAVKSLFGEAGDNEKDISTGNVMFDDLFFSGLPTKTIPHVAIDRFTGGELHGALFSEKVIVGKDSVPFKTKFWVKRQILADDDIKYAWETALSDLCNGLLPLGGGVNRGNGVFTGSYTIK